MKYFWNIKRAHQSHGFPVRLLKSTLPGPAFSFSFYMTFYISRLAFETIVIVKRQIEPLPQTKSAADNGEKECLILQSAFGIDILKGATVRRQGAAISPSNIAKPLIASQRSSASRLFVLGKLTTQNPKKSSPFRV